MEDKVLTISDSETRIHPTALVDPAAELDRGVAVGPFAVIEGDVKIGADSTIGSHACVGTGARLGRAVHVHHGAAVGTIPQDLKFGGEKSELIVGDRTIIREFATLNRGTKVSGRTVVGSDCLIMAYAHVAHDCILGDHVILANAVQLGGHVLIRDWVVIGGGTVVHQFCTLGTHAMIGGGFRVTQDVLPYVVVGGYPLKTLSLNRVGLERRGFDAEKIEILSKVFRIVFRSGLNKSQAVDRLREQMADCAEAQEIRVLIAESERGIVR